MSEEIKVHFVFEDETIDEKIVHIETNSTIAQAAYKGGVHILQTCGATPSCADCVVKLLEFKEDSLPEMEIEEKGLLGNVFFITQERLACQCRLKNDCKVKVPRYKTK